MRLPDLGWSLVGFQRSGRRLAARQALQLPPHAAEAPPVLRGRKADLAPEQAAEVRGILVAHGLGDGLVFVPHRLTQAGGLQRDAHGAADVVPVQQGALFDQRVLRGAVERGVKRQIGVDHGLDVAALHSGPAHGQQSRVQGRAALGGQPDGQRHVDVVWILVLLRYPT